jgi:DNA-binding winged helix-turn-helix (wHTH) protein/Tol biopolymer transport system component
MSDHAFGFKIVPPSRQFRFGPFQVDSRSGELRKHGIKIRIGQQTIQLLLMLLEHPGDVVLREEIRLKLWPNDTVVEFDHSINAAIQKLRAALGESAGSPLYIETLARRGYRFVGTVETAPPNPPAVPAVPTEPKAEEPAAVQVKEVRLRSTRTVPVFAGLTVLMALLALGISRPWAVRDPPRTWTLPLGSMDYAVVSPDGSAVVYSTAHDWVLRRMDSIAEIPLHMPERVGDFPAWSPDGSQLLVRTSSQIVRLPLPNGPPTPLSADIGPTRGLAWSADGSMITAMFAAKLGSGGLYLIPPEGGNPRRLEVPRLTDGMFFYPEFLPDGKNLLFAWDGGDAETGLYLATIDGGKVVKGPLLIRKNQTAGHYTPSGGGRLLYVQDDNLYAQKLNVSRAVLEGTPERILDGVYSEPARDFADFSVSRNGVLVWRAGRAALAQPTWFDRTGKVLGAMGPLCFPESVRISPDEKRVVLRTTAGYGIAEPNRSGFVPLRGLTDEPLWMPDSLHIVYGRRKKSGVLVVERAAEGGPEKELRSVPELGSALDISPDGNVLLYHTGPKLFSVRLDDPGSTPQLLANAVAARFSPDGRWVAYTTLTNNRWEIWVQRFPSAGLPVQLTSDGGYDLVWRGDGQEMFYRYGSTIYSLRLHVQGNSLRADPPQRLFDVRAPAGLAADTTPMAVTHDGSRILFEQGVEQPGSQLTYVMTSWETALRH